MNKNVRRNFIWSMIGSTFNAFNSLFFMIIVTRINGINDAGIFTFAFSTACLFYIIGSYAGRTYQVTDNSKEITDSDYIYSRFVTCISMIVLSICFCLIRSYNIYKSIVIVLLVFFKSLEAFSEVLYAIIQKEDQLYKVGISMTIKALGSIILFFIADYFIKNMIISILFIEITNIITILTYDLKNIKQISFKLQKINKNNILKILRYGFYAFAFSLLTQYVINAPKYAIDTLLGDDFQTIFGIIFMPATIVILLGQFILQPFLLNIKNSLMNSKKSFFRLIFILSFSIVVLGLIFLIIMYFIGIPLLELLYSIDLNDYLKSLIIIIIGGIFYGVTLLLSTSLTTMRSTFSQLIIFIVVTISSYFLSNFLVEKYKLLGASCAYMYTMILLAILYVITFLIVLKRYGGND